jgi:hypothetical protein
MLVQSAMKLVRSFRYLPLMLIAHFLIHNQLLPILQVPRSHSQLLKLEPPKLAQCNVHYFVHGSFVETLPGVVLTFTCRLIFP